MTTKVDVTAESKLACTPGEQSEYCDRRTRENNTNGGQRGVQVPTTLLHKVAVIFVGFTLEIPRGFEKRDGKDQASAGRLNNFLSTRGGCHLPAAAQQSIFKLLPRSHRPSRFGSGFCTVDMTTVPTSCKDAEAPIPYFENQTTDWGRIL